MSHSLAHSAETPRVRLLIGQPTRGSLPIEHLECLDALGHHCAAENVGLRIARIIGCSLIDHARSILATRFLLEDDSDVMVWIDDDMVFDPADLVRLADEARTIDGLVGAPAIQKKMGGSLNFQLPEGSHRIGFFQEGSLKPVRTIGTGILAGTRSAYERVAAHMTEAHGIVTDGKGKTLYPLFCPLIHDGLYWGEDASFCIRARAAGVPVMVDTRMRVLHLGKHLFGVEEAAQETVRYERLFLRAHQPRAGAPITPNPTPPEMPPSVVNVQHHRSRLSLGEKGDVA